MRSKPSKFLENCRIKAGPLGSNASYGFNGAFEIIDGSGTPFLVIASDQGGWDHVSTSILGQQRCPTWEEMCFVKRLFWRDDETAVEYHPAEEHYVNNHRYTLHLWKPQKEKLPAPPPIMVGVKSMGTLS